LEILVEARRTFKNGHNLKLIFLFYSFVLPYFSISLKKDFKELEQSCMGYHADHHCRLQV